MLPPKRFWSGYRTKNLATWNKAFAVLVGHSHPSVLVAFEAFQVDLTLAEQVIDLDALGQLPVKRVKRNTHQLLYCVHSSHIILYSVLSDSFSGTKQLIDIAN